MAILESCEGDRIMNASIEVSLPLDRIAHSISTIDNELIIDFVIALDGYVADTSFTRYLISRLLHDLAVYDEDGDILAEVSRQLKTYGVE